MSKAKNPAAGDCGRVLDIKAVGTALDTQNFTETLPDFQSEILAVRSVMRRFRVSLWHAKTICCLSGLGGVV